MSLLLLNANSLHIPLADKSVHCCVTSPPYWGLRDYGISDQLGLEAVPDCLGWATGQPCGVCYICHTVAWAREVRRVLRDDGTFWLNLGDSYNASPGGSPSKKYVVDETEGDGVYARRYRNNHQGGYDKDKDARTKAGWKIDGLKPKDLCGIPWRVAFALQADGWYLRSDIIWAKPNPMPESVTDRPTKAHEYLFLLAKAERYYYDADAIAETSINAGRIVQYDGTQKNSEAAQDPRMRTRIDQTTIVNNTRNRRTVWNIATAPYSGAHFATFPPALVEPCIKAGTSERGCCPKCGRGWERVVEKGEFIPMRWAPGDDKTQRAQRLISGRTSSSETSAMVRGGVNERITTGFSPACDCFGHFEKYEQPWHDYVTGAETRTVFVYVPDGPQPDPIPAVVLDPFAGSGTTLMVARSLGRNAVGLDLSFAYLRDQARSRLDLDRLDAWTNGKKDGASVADLPLFMEQST